MGWSAINFKGMKHEKLSIGHLSFVGNSFAGCADNVGNLCR